MRNVRIPIPYVLMFGLSMIFTGCETESTGEESWEGLTPRAVNFEAKFPCSAVIDFTPIAAGTVVTSLSYGNGVSGAATTGSISVYGENLDPARPDINHAMIFDTDNPTGDDSDLVVPGADNQEVLIISENLDTANPDDDGVPGGVFTFDFSDFGPGIVDVGEFTAVDTEEGGSYEAYDVDGILIADGEIGMIADGTFQQVAVNAKDVELLVIILDGSGAVDNFCINLEEGDEGCSLTQGFWKNPKKGSWPEPFNRDDIFFLSGKTYQQVLKTSARGNAYYQASHQFIAASLNVANGASSPDEVDGALTLGGDLFSTYTPAEIGALKGNDPLRAQFLSVNDILDSYNNGEIGPGHCDD